MSVQLKDTTYNGWRNYETWNVALWIQNDEGIYLVAQTCRDYVEFVGVMKDADGDFSFQTPDGVTWIGDTLDTEALDKMIGEL